MMNERAIRGTLAAIMESWPMQLSIISNSERFSIVLAEDTKIMRGGKQISAGDLRVGQLMCVTGNMTSRDPSSMTADRLEILD